MAIFDLSQLDITLQQNYTSGVLSGSPALETAFRPVVATQHPLSALVGLRVLEAGGTAADALVAMVGVDQVVVPGTSSLGGTLALIYHDARAGQTHVLNGGLNLPLNDTAPYSQADQATGRAILVPGVVRGLEKTWKRFGRLAWSDLWEPAHYLARSGFIINNYYASILRYRQPVILRHPAGRAIFAPSGQLPQAGSFFQQTELAATLEGIAHEGAGYIYQGWWAKHLVEAVQAQGGFLTLNDLARYTATWETPTVGSYLDYEVRTLSSPQYGGPALLLMFNLAEALDLHTQPIRSVSAFAFYKEVQIFKAIMGEAASTLIINPAFTSSEQQARFAGMLSKDYARQRAALLAENPPDSPMTRPDPGTHQIVVLDGQGNIASATHSISSAPWGDSGIFVGGIALNSGAMLVQANRMRLARAGYDPAVFLPPGGRHSEALCSYLVFHNGKPYLAGGAIGAGLLGCNFQNNLNVLAHHLSLAESVNLSRWGFFELGKGPIQAGTPLQTEPFDDKVLDEVERLGQPLARRNRADQPPRYSGLTPPHKYADTGGWTAIRVGATIEGVTDPRQARLFRPFTQAE